MTKKRVAVGLSGGVDSAVCVHLLLEQGYEVVGVFLKIWDESDPHCPVAEDSAWAEKVAQHFDIPIYRFDFSDNYRRHVFDYFLNSLRQHETPNPDVFCNRYIKFGSFFEVASYLKADFIATGHYAKKNFRENLYELVIPSDKNKDQTYFLLSLTQKALSKTLFPLADFTKDEVRKIAKKINLPNADKKDSTGICMVGDRDFMPFVSQYISENEGDIVTDTGQKVARHKGLWFYTLGQRKNIGVGGVKNTPEAPWFVYAKDPSTNQLFITQDESQLLQSELCFRPLNFISGCLPKKNREYFARVRYRQDLQPCVITSVSEDKIFAKFSEPQRAITPGQFCVLYDGDVCLGGGALLPEEKGKE